MKSIQYKILTVVILGLLVVTAIVSTIAVSMTHEIMHQDADRILGSETLKEAAQINDMFGDVSKSTTIMKYYALSQIHHAEQLRDPEFLQSYLDNTRQMFTEIALNTDGIQGYYLRINPEYADSTTGYYDLVMSQSYIRSMPVTDLSRYALNDQQNASWYYSPINAGEALWLEPYYFPGFDKMLISYAAPLYADGVLLGVIGFDLNFEYLVRHINEISVYEEGYAVLLSADGETAYNNQNRTASQEPHTKATAELRNGMHLELRADYKDIQRNIHPMLAQIVFAFLAVLAGAIVYTIIVTHRIVRPLKQLTHAAKALAEGKGDANRDTIPVDSADEVGTLARVLQNTYAKISEYTAYINALAYRDSLTGIKNSTAYTEAIADLNREINLTNARFGVMVADINNLKQTNDHYGHDVGNELITHTARILTDVFKTSAVFRIGGDEFVVLLKGNDLENYHGLIQRLDTACAEDHISVLEETLPVEMARGVAVFDPEIDKVYEDVFAKADHAMYLHKEQSKAVPV